MPLTEVQSWKRLAVLPEQTVLQSLEIEFPEVRGATRFLVVWFDGDKKLGTVPVNVYPTGLLKPLAVLAGTKPLGVIDPEGRLQSALAGFQMDQLKEAEDVTSAETRLILIAPMSPESIPAGIASALKKKASDGCAVVWIQPATGRQPELLPDAYVVNEGAGKIVVASASTIAGLQDSPQAQLNLVRLAELAAGHKQLELPNAP